MAVSTFIKTINGYEIRDVKSIHSLSASGTTITITKGDGTTDTITTQDTVYTHPTSGVTAGTYKSVTVDANGHVTAGTNPTTIAGYGITDAKIASGVITLGSNTITPLVATSTLDATKLSGKVPLDCIPAAALERCVVVADDTARMALTNDNVQTGDTVKVTSTGKMYFVKDDTKLNAAAGYEEYVVGTAASVDWSGIQNVPNYAGSATKGGSATSAEKLNTNAGSVTQPVYFANGVPVATTYALNATVPSDAVFTDTVYEHPTHTAAASGLYKVTVDGLGHVTATSAVVKKDITDLGIPETNTTYSDFTGASASAAGAHGLVPAPAAGANAKFLRGDATWATLSLNITDDGAGNITFGLVTQP